MQGVLDSIELRMLRRVDYLTDRKILGESHVQSYVTQSVLVLGWVGWADSLLSLAFATRWNPKHLSYVSTWFFVTPSPSSAAECRLYEMFKPTDKWSKLLCINYNTTDWSSLWNNSRFIDKILCKISQLLKYSCYIIHTMLLLASNGVANIQILNCLSFHLRLWYL